MEPVSIVTIVATAVKIIECCSRAVVNLDRIKYRWKDTPPMLSSIGTECTTTAQIIENIKGWLEEHQEELWTEHETFLDALSSSLIHCLDTLQRLRYDTKKVSKWQRFKLSLNNDSNCLLTTMPSVNAEKSFAGKDKQPPAFTRLSIVERKEVAEKVKMSQMIHSSRTSLAGSSAGSILDGNESYDKVERKRAAEKVKMSQMIQTSRTSVAGSSAGSILDGNESHDKVDNLVDNKMMSSSASILDGNEPHDEVDNLVDNRMMSSSVVFLSKHKWLWISFIVVLASVALVQFFTGAVDFTAGSVDEASKHALFTAAGAGSSGTVTKLLKLGVKPSIRDHVNLWTPLHYAAANGSTKTIDVLLKYKDTGWFADNDMTPLHLAAKHGHTAAVRQILKLSGHDWDKERAKDQQAIEKIKTSTQSRYDKQFETFLQRKTFTARELAVIYGHTNTLLAFQSHSRGNTLHAFSCACMIGDFDMVETLWKNITRFRHPSVSGGSQVRWFPAPPLHLAVMSGSRATVAFLLERGLQANAQSTNYVSGFSTEAYPPYSSPAHYAAAVGSAEILVALERRRADLTALDHRLRTPLSYAVENLNVAAVLLLVERKPRKASGWFSGSTTDTTYLGSGHVWLDKKHKAAAISNPQIVRALENIGIHETTETVDERKDLV
ncbi:MAG: hypothetical protein L6R42_000580 [Xanthoria sp. 1 TBL-2021]|nr:MAG: hypothetical protein L6R42_000580 [Xanthoria sp. 1 TBL-2021]